MVNRGRRYLGVGIYAVLDQPRCEERPMNMLPMMVELCVREVGPLLEEAEDSNRALSIVGDILPV